MNNLKAMQAICTCIQTRTTDKCTFQESNYYLGKLFTERGKSYVAIYEYYPQTDVLGNLSIKTRYMDILPSEEFADYFKVEPSSKQVVRGYWPKEEKEIN